MVRATVNLAPEKHNLKSVEGGFVTLKRLTYGQKVERQEMALENVMKADQGGGNRKQRRSGRGQAENVEMTMKTMHRAVTLFDFKNCIVDHNLENENGQKLNFQDPNSLNILDPKIGEEINQLIDDMNNFEEGEQEQGNSSIGSKEQ